MKNNYKYIICLLLFLFHAGVFSQVTLKDSYKAVVKINVFDDNDSIINEGNGFFINENGDVVTSLRLMINASRAEIVDFSKNRYKINRVLGIDSQADIIVLSVANLDKFHWIESKNVNVEINTSNLYTVKFSHKKIKPIKCSILRTENLDNYKYYYTDVQNLSDFYDVPLINEDGILIAIMQKNYDKNSNNSCAIDFRVLDNIKITAKSAFDYELSSIKIPKSIPNEEKEALTYIYMLNNKDSLQTISAMSDFINKYPYNIEGYINRANFYASHALYELCDEDYFKGINIAETMDSISLMGEIYYAYSKTIFNAVARGGNSLSSSWNFDKALQYAEKAFEYTHNLYYLLQQANCLFYMKNFKLSYEKFYEICCSFSSDLSNSWSNQAKSEVWFYAARTLELSDGNKDEVVALLDSAIAVLQKPYAREDATLFLERAQRHIQNEQYRLAVLDYNEYENIIGPLNLNDKFYFLREQAELEGRMYQQALDDIDTAINKNPDNYYYLIEKALILLKVSLFDDAIGVCSSCLTKLPENPDCYKIIGIAYGEKGEKQKSLNALNKAKQLYEDNSVDEYIEKYK